VAGVIDKPATATHCFESHIRCPSLQVLDKNTVKFVAGKFDLLVVDKEEAAHTPTTTAITRPPNNT
jgi:hypothetical protein